MPMTELMFTVFKTTQKCNEIDTFYFQDWLVYLAKLKEAIPQYSSLSSIQVQPMGDNDGGQSFSLIKAVQSIIDFCSNLEASEADSSIQSSAIHLVRNALSRFVKQRVISMLKMLAPKVYEERYNKKCVDWAADSFLFCNNPNISSFKGNPQLVDTRTKIIYQRKLHYD